MESKVTVICGFPGVGKTEAARRDASVVDLESSGYKWRWDRDSMIPRMVERENWAEAYINTSAELTRAGTQYSHVLLSTHKEVRDELKRRGIRYLIVMPKLHHKEEYMQRYLFRGSDADFILKMDNEWREMVNSCAGDDAPKIYLRRHQYLSDVLPPPGSRR